MGEQAVLSPAELAKQPLLDPEACQEFADLMAEDFKRLSRGFEHDISEAIAEIGQLDQTQLEHMAELAHKYKSAAGYIGAFQLRGALEQLELAARAGDFARCQQMRSLAEAVTPQTVAALEDYIRAASTQR